jgi:uncharacterized protein
MSQVIRIQVKLRRRRPEVSVEGKQLVVHVKSPPENGRANREVLKLLADFFAVPYTEIEIKSGAQAHFKWLLIPDTIDVNRFLGGIHE